MASYVNRLLAAVCAVLCACLMGLVSAVPTARAEEAQYCGDLVEFDQSEIARGGLQAFSKFSQNYYTQGIAGVHAALAQQGLHLDKDVFCRAVSKFIQTGSQNLVLGAIGTAMAGRELSWAQKQAFRAYSVGETNGMPRTIPAVGPGSAPIGVTVNDSYFGGTWAYTDVWSGEWVSRAVRPSNSPYWFPNGLGLAVYCHTSGASYPVYFMDGRSEVWSTWLGVTDGTFVKSAAVGESVTDDGLGLPPC